MLRRICALFVIFLCSCTEIDNNNDREIEKEIRTTVIKEGTYISSLEATYLITWTFFIKNLIQSDDIYIQKDKASFKYGFKIDENTIKIIRKNGRKVLQVILPQGERVAIDRNTLSTETTHTGYRPQKDGCYIDIDQEINDELDKIDKDYGKEHLKFAKENIKNFFRVLAKKYDLELEIIDG